MNPQGQAQMRPVTVLNDDGTNESIQGKIKPGDKVVTEGQMQVIDGTHVTIDKSRGAPPAPAQPIGAQ